MGQGLVVGFQAPSRCRFLICINILFLVASCSSLCSLMKELAISGTIVLMM